MEEERLYLLALRLTEGLDPRMIFPMVESLGSARAVFDAPANEIEKRFGVAAETAASIREKRSLKKAEEEWSELQKLSARIVMRTDLEYPRYLKEIHDPPPVLFQLGRWKDEDGLSLAIVGSRQATPQGVSIARKFAGELAALGFTIVSGLARGIDAAAHEAALEASGRTVAVLGTGLDVPYPQCNKRLRKRIEEQGALITEFPLGTRPFPGNFPIRNRIISGLCLGTMVVEAASRSGSLITARLALEQGREVFAVPGSILAGNAAGSNALIQQGAKLVMDLNDVLEELPPAVQEAVRSRKSEGGETREDEGLSPDARRVFELIKAEAPVHIDRIAEHLNLPVHGLSEILFMLEMKDLIKQIPGKMYISR